MNNPVVQISQLENIEWCDTAMANYTTDQNNHVWRIRITPNLSYIAKLSDMLCADESERAQRYYREADRQRFIISRAALRVLLGRYLGLDLKQIIFGTGENKKPYVKGNSGLCYNVSHSGDYILIAFSNSALGIDVEQPDPGMHFDEIMQISYSNPETEYVKSSPDQPQAFYALWTRKEALLKATGKGIDDTLKFVPCLDGHHTTLYNTIGSEKNWVVQSFNVDDGYLGCIASAQSSIIFFNFNL